MTYLLLTHGAGSNRNAALLVALANAFSEHDVEVIRYDLPYRQERPHGPPRPGDAARDREGLREQILKLREKQADQVWLGGHSYGGRQASMLAAEAPGIGRSASVCFLIPCIRPASHEQLRTAHFPKLQTPAFFVHGSKDPFGYYPRN